MPVKRHFQLSIEKHIIPLLPEYTFKQDGELDWWVKIGKSWRPISICNSDELFLRGPSERFSSDAHEFNRFMQELLDKCQPEAQELTIHLYENLNQINQLEYHLQYHLLFFQV